MGTQQSNRIARSLADDLRGRSPGQVRRLLAVRPDLLQPWPTDLSQLARRAADDASVLTALSALSTPSLRVLEVFAALHDATIEQVSQALAEDVADVVQDLWERALLWGGPVYKAVRAAQQAFGAFPCGLSSASHVTPDPQAVHAAAADLDPDRLRYLVWEQPVSTTANPLTVIRGEQNVVPREVALILRQGLYLPAAQPPERDEQTPVAGPPAIWNVLAGVRYVLTDLARRPLTWNAARGVSRRVLQDRATAMAVPVEELAVWLELAAVAGLVGGVDTCAHPTAEAQRWLYAGEQAMWRELVEAWLDSDRPLLRCRPDDLGVLTTAGVARTGEHRRQVLAVWPRGRVNAQDLAEVLAWERPRLVEARERSNDFLAELTALGLLPGGVAVADISAPWAITVPATDNALIVQPDHTIIAAANVDTATWDLLHDIAHVESWGPVIMHRVDLSRLRAAAARRSPEHILAQLAQSSRTALPQSLEYLVKDAARAAPVQVSRVTLIRSSAQESQALRDLGWQEVAAGTFISEQPLDAVQRLLAQAGVAASSADQPTVALPLEYVRAAPPDPEAVDRLVAHLVEATEQVADAPDLQPADPAQLRQVLQARRVWLEFGDGQQTLTHLVEPLEVRSGQVTGWSLTAARTITIPLSRIAAVRIADD